MKWKMKCFFCSMKRQMCLIQYYCSELLQNPRKNWELPPRFSRLGVPVTGVDLKFSLEKVVLLPKLEVLTWSIKGCSGEIYLACNFIVHCFQSLKTFLFVCLFSLKSTLYLILNNVFQASGGRAEMHNILLPILVQAEIGCVLRM